MGDRPKSKNPYRYNRLEKKTPNGVSLLNIIPGFCVISGYYKKSWGYPFSAATRLFHGRSIKRSQPEPSETYIQALREPFLTGANDVMSGRWYQHASFIK